MYQSLPYTLDILSDLRLGRRNTREKSSRAEAKDIDNVLDTKFNDIKILFKTNLSQNFHRSHILPTESSVVSNNLNS